MSVASGRSFFKVRFIHVIVDLNEIFSFRLLKISITDDDLQKETLEKLLEMAKTSCMLEMKVKESHSIMERLTSERNDCNENLEVPDHQETLQVFFLFFFRGLSNWYLQYYSAGI